MITVKVGPEEKAYRVLKPILVHHSEYFRKALQSDKFEEGRTGVVRLPEIEPSIFNVFVDWLYAPKPASKWRKYLSKLAIDTDMGYVLVYTFADRFMVASLKETCVKALARDYDKNSSRPNYKTITTAFQNLPSEDPLLDLLVEVHCQRWNEDDDSNDQDELFSLPPSFLFQVMKKYSQRYGELGEDLGDTEGEVSEDDD